MLYSVLHYIGDYILKADSHFKSSTRRNVYKELVYTPDLQEYRPVLKAKVGSIFSLS